MTDYAARLDAETWAFIRATESHSPKDGASLSIAEQRANYDALCAAFDVGRPESVTTTDSIVGAVPIRTYECSPTAATILFAHGGGFVLGGLESHDSICAEICARTGLRVVAVDYRLVPEHLHPAAYDDALAVTRWALETHDGPLVLCGDSAGATLVASVVHTLRDKIAGQVLIYPALGGDTDAGSYKEHAEAPLLARADMLFYWDIRGGCPGGGDSTLEPLQDTDFANLPRTLIVSAECDPLSSDGEAYRDRILAAGGQAEWINETGLVHGYLRARHSVRRARHSFDRIVAGLAAFAVK